MKYKKGSLTIETALVLPIFMSLSIALVSVLEMITLYSRVEYALHETAREIAIAQYPIEYVKQCGEEIFESKLDSDVTEYIDFIPSGPVARILFTEKFGFKNISNSLIKNGELGIMFFRSEVLDEEGNVDLIATYRVEPLFNLFKVGEMTFANRAKVHAWNGYSHSKNSEKDQYVYITETGTVYHTNRNCSHLHVTVLTVYKEKLDECRNKDGKKYYPCEKCAGKDKGEGEFVYVTPYGTSYHTSLSCSGLKRTIYKVTIGEVGGRGLCDWCAGYKRGEIKSETDVGEYDNGF
ncbi:MAG: pilus assembly protein [Lachnospiraceae bacterium]|nr:pilus assembly protein [Lachnospiraceae bacterium]